ncbi:hypothetical protein COO60DRAFT_692200 [Scenedesmus sp. NREL 46B-D3]|nr:hypothetical protein COO60DRAFT_692200 [Scenedesmus sp. NREL 46B-D3]
MPGSSFLLLWLAAGVLLACSVACGACFILPQPRQCLLHRNHYSSGYIGHTTLQSLVVIAYVVRTCATTRTWHAPSYQHASLTQQQICWLTWHCTMTLLNLVVRSVDGHGADDFSETMLVTIQMNCALTVCAWPQPYGCAACAALCRGQPGQRCRVISL